MNRLVLFRAITLCIDLILSISLLKIFVNKLYQVSKGLYIDEYDLLSNKSQNDDHSRQTLQHQKEHIYCVVSKVVVLGIIMIITSQLTLIFSLINWIINTDNDDTITLIYSFIKSTQTFIASLSLFLGFEFMDNWYNYCCRICHKKVKQCCVNKINDKIKQNIQYNYQ